MCSTSCFQQRTQNKLSVLYETSQTLLQVQPSCGVVLTEEEFLISGCKCASCDPAGKQSKVHEMVFCLKMPVKIQVQRTSFTLPALKFMCRLFWQIIQNYTKSGFYPWAAKQSRGVIFCFCEKYTNNSSNLATLAHFIFAMWCHNPFKWRQAQSS